MKKILIIISLCLIGMSFCGQEEEIRIPDEAIRFRVIARSNSKEDQEIKLKVKDALQKDLSNLLKNSNSIEDTRKTLKGNENHFKSIINDTLLQNREAINYKINYGLNYFPKKTYKGITYDEGYYESLVVTLGSGMGENWWCVLFPPLCLLEEEEKTSNVEYKSYVKELIDKYF